MPDARTRQPGAPETDQTLQLFAEQAQVAVIQKVTGRVRIRTVTDTETTSLTQSLTQTHVDVTRVPVGVVIAQGAEIPATRTLGEVTIIPVFEERAVVTTQLILTEELHITRRTTTRDVDVPVSLRRQRAIVDQPDPDGGALSPLTGQPT